MNANIKQSGKALEPDDRNSALLSNTSAISALASAVEGTLGPKGLNCMLVDGFGDVTITNDGSTILDRIDANHPAVKMMVHAAKSQDAEVGDGTTTTIVLAAALISEGYNQVIRGVPVTKVIEGISLGIDKALDVISKSAKPVSDIDDPLLQESVLISARGCHDIAQTVSEAASIIGHKRLSDPGFKLADTIIAKEGTENKVFNGLIIDKTRMNRMMPACLENPVILVIDDALEPEQVGDEALGTESGFARYLQLQNEFTGNIRKIISLGVNTVFVYKSVSDAAEEMLTEAGVMVIRRVSASDIERIAKHTGAKMLKKTGLNKSATELEDSIGKCKMIHEDEKLEHILITGGTGDSAVTILIGSSTREMKEERKRIAEDASSAAQAIIRGGVVPGGGAIEIAAMREIIQLRGQVKGMRAYGVDCVIQALKKPLFQIVANAGFNPLEKVEDTIAAQIKSSNKAIAINCDTGEVDDMEITGVFDPALVVINAIKIAAETANAILKINTIIKMRESDRSASGG